MVYMNRIYLTYGSNLQSILLETGRHPDFDGVWVAQELKGQDILFERVDSDTQGPSTLGIWFKAIRAISLTATFMPSMAILLWFQLMEVAINPYLAASSIMGVLFLQVSVNLFNDVGDYLKLIDLPTSLGGSGVIQNGWLTCKQVKEGAQVSLIIGCLLGLPALWASPAGVLLCGFLAVIGVVTYSGKPFNLKYKALGDVAVYGLCGPILTMGLSYGISGELQLGVLLIGSYFGFAAAAILNANNMNDIKVDTNRGAVTLASVLGFKLARKLQLGYYIAAFFSLYLLLEHSGLIIFIPLLLLPLAWAQYKKLKATNNSSDVSLENIRFDAAKLHLLMGGLLCASFIVMMYLN